MTSRFLAPVLAALLAAPAPAQDKPDLPPFTAQTLPVGKILADVKATMRLAMGPDAEPAIKKFDRMLEDKLGDKGFEGLDLTRPLAVCAFLPEKFDFESLLNGKEPDPKILEEFYGFVLVPVTNEKDFLGLLNRLSVEVKPVKGTKGLYAIIPDGKEIDDDPPIRFRFHAGHAYIGINADDQDLDAEDLPPAADVIAPGETALVSERVYYQRFPAGVKKDVRGFLDKLPKWLADAPLPDPAKDALKPLVGLYSRYAQQIVDDGDTGIVRFKLDPVAGEFGYEFALAAKPGSKLAKEIAARKPTTNDFAGLIGPNTAGGFVLQLPLFAPEIRDAVQVGLDFGKQMTADKVPDEVKDVVAELWKGVGRTVKGGEFDLAGAVAGPDKAGLYTASVAISYAGAADLEKVLRKKLADAPEEIQNQVKLDADKANGVSIHRMPVGLFLPPEAKKVFGDRPSLAVAFGPKGVYATFGPDAVGAMKAALAAKPGPAKGLDVFVNPARVGKLSEAAKPGTGAETEKMLGTEDKLLSMYGLSVEGGSELTLRFSMNLLPFAKGMAAGLRGGEN